MNMTTYCHIWIGTEMPHELRESMNSITRHFVAGDQYIFVSDGEYPDMEATDHRDKIVEQIRDSEFARDWVAMHEKLVEGERFSLDMAESDFIRMFLATRYDDLLYLDCDCTLKKPLPELEPYKPYFGRLNELRVDLCIFHANGQRAYFSQLIHDYCSAKEITRRTLWGTINRRDVGDFGMIPQDCFEHEGVSKCLT